MIFIFIACNSVTNEFTPSEKFRSIFVNPSEGVNYQPLDVIQTEDGGYLILAESALDAVFILKATAQGRLSWSATLPATYENPVGDLIFSDGKYYFIASTSNDQTAILIEVDDLNQTVSPTQRTYVGYRKPLAFGRLNTESFLLLNYNDTTGAVLSKIQSGFAQEWARRYDTTATQTALLDELRENRSVNFFVGGFNNGENAYFHALRNNGFVMTFTNGEGIESGKITGTFNDFIVSFNYLGSQIAAINYNLAGSSYFQLEGVVQASDSLSLRLLSGSLLVDKEVDANAMTINDEIVATSNVINIYSTVDGRVKWTSYGINGGSINEIDYVGGDDPQKLIKAIPTTDGGILILSIITLAGSRDRIAIQKIPSAELKGLN